VESRNAERARLRAERDKLKATDPEGLAEAWAMIESLWSGTIARARKQPEPVLHEQVNGEWSFVQTHRHLVLATDCWLRRMVKGIASPYHPWGLGGSWLTSPRRWGLDPDADPSLDQVLDLAIRGKRTPCCTACMWCSTRSGSTTDTRSATLRCSRNSPAER